MKQVFLFDELKYSRDNKLVGFDSSRSPMFIRVQRLLFKAKTAKTIYTILMLGLAINFIVKLFPYSIARGRYVDFNLFYDACRKVFSGTSAYGVKGFIFPPPSIFFLAPFAILDFDHAILAWLIFSIMLLVLIIVLTIALAYESGQRNLLDTLCTTAMLLGLRATHVDLLYANVNLLMAFLTLTSLYALKRGRLLFAGGLIAIASGLKALPALLIPYLGWSKKFKAFLSSIVFSLLLAISSLVAFGWGILREYIEVVEKLNPYPLMTSMALAEFLGFGAIKAYMAMAVILIVSAYLTMHKAPLELEYLLILETALLMSPRLWHTHTLLITPLLVLFMLRVGLMSKFGLALGGAYFALAILTKGGTELALLLLFIWALTASYYWKTMAK